MTEYMRKREKLTPETTWKYLLCLHKRHLYMIQQIKLITGITYVQFFRKAIEEEYHKLIKNKGI